MIHFPTATAGAFDCSSYSLIEDEEEHAAGKLHTLEQQQSSSSSSGDPPLRVSALAWSSSGSSPALAVAFERPGEDAHPDWCDHETALCVWNVARRDFDPGNPHRK